MKKNRPVARHLHQLTHERQQAFALPLLDRTGPLSCDRLLYLSEKTRASFHGFYFNDEVVAKLYFHTRNHLRQAQEEIDGLHALQDAGCATPQFLYAGPSSDQAVSVILLKWMPHARTIYGLWPEIGKNDELRARVLHQLAEQLAQQHMAGVFLNEPHLSQYMWFEDSVLCIDGGRVQKNKTPLPQAQGLKAFAALFAHFSPQWDALVDSASKVYFLSRYGNTHGAESFTRECKKWRFKFRQKRARKEVQGTVNTAPLNSLLNAPHNPYQDSDDSFIQLNLNTKSFLLAGTSEAKKAEQFVALCRAQDIPFLAPIHAEQSDGHIALKFKSLAIQSSNEPENIDLLLSAIKNLIQLGVAPKAPPKIAADPLTTGLLVVPMGKWRFHRSAASAQKQWHKKLKQLQALEPSLHSTVDSLLTQMAQS